MNETLQQAMTLARSGQMAAAAELLQSLVAREPENGEAWLWLAGLSADPAERLRALQRAVAINPGDRRAQQGLDALRQQHPQLFAEAAPAAVPQFFDTPAPSFAPPVPQAAEPAARELGGAAGHDIYTATTRPLPVAVSPTSNPAVAQARTARASIYDAPTVAQPVVTAPPRVPPSTVAERRMADIAPVVPVATATAQMPVIAPRRGNPIAFVARVLLAIVWLFITALLVLTAAFALRYARQAVSVSIGLPLTVQAMTGLGSLSTSGGSLLAIGIASGVLALIGAVATLGMILRWRIALVLSLVVGFLVAIAGVVTGVIAYFGGEDISGAGSLLQLGSKTGGIVVGVLLLWPMLLAFISWSEFTARRQTT